MFIYSIAFQNSSLWSAQCVFCPCLYSIPGQQATEPNSWFLCWIQKPRPRDIDLPFFSYALLSFRYCSWSLYIPSVSLPKGVYCRVLLVQTVGSVTDLVFNPGSYIWKRGIIKASYVKIPVLVVRELNSDCDSFLGFYLTGHRYFHTHSPLWKNFELSLLKKKNHILNAWPYCLKKITCKAFRWEKSVSMGCFSSLFRGLTGCSM